MGQKTNTGQRIKGSDRRTSKLYAIVIPERRKKQRRKKNGKGEKQS